MKSFVLLVLVAVSSVSALKFGDCGSKAKDIKITVSGCDESMDACPFVKGTNVTMTADFTACE
jgi:epoxyqueuosine reductase QueG